MSSETPKRTILALVTSGGFTHAAPVLDICRVLADRGHTIQFATHDGQEIWTKNYGFIKAVYNLGPGPTEEQFRDHWERMVDLKVEEALGSSRMWKSKYLWDSFWPATYKLMKGTCLDPKTRPDFIIADFFAEALTRDMMLELGVPIAIVWPQMPYLLAPASYIPGQPGFQVDVTLTSEHASLWSRLRNELAVVWAVPQFVTWMGWFTKLRQKNGAKYPMLPGGSRPHHLVLVNSFFGLEAPKDLPPLVAAVGPILSDEYPGLDEKHASFLEAHSRTVYVALGTNIVLPKPAFQKLLAGLVKALDAGTVNGVIWALNKANVVKLERGQRVTRANGRSFTIGELVDGAVPEFLVPRFAPQRAILDHPNSRVFITHAGGSSANEAVYHGIPVIVLGFVFDQLANGVRMEEAGVGLQLEKNTFTAEKVASHLSTLLDEEANESYMRNVERMKNIARTASRRKHHAAGLIEEVMYDWELRVARPMHLQTADMRMPWWKVQNLDLAVFALANFVGLPAAVVFGIRSLMRGQPLSSFRDTLPQLFRSTTSLVGQVLSNRFR
ncbi:putative UDP-glucoronosyl and UDP-glucosyl transferase [Dactylonectria macrodidyma]|uniref:UDP-glucoronosyl and UDP-glucosyl transferase n=1 Tax=Dactylonectria macrodidyma TaxID=307937 RepID=A0A9P9ETM2_9HYPO|nr:putative UDP-glucoronosyl and UDP-glucosyl transferase [Dactylonectria macrodidyma]